jgi:Kef-type K+ transport system membrane component KefB
MQFDGGALLVTAVIAVLAPLISEIPIGLRLPMVVVEVGLGILVGPHVLGWASPTGMLALLGYLGLIFLFLPGRNGTGLRCRSRSTPHPRD